MLALDKIVWLHAEITNRCNAHCPACARNNSGYGLRSSITLTDLPVERFCEIISQLPALETVQLCGTFGDPVASKNLLEIIQISVDKNYEVQIHTNGSLKTKEWWRDLADKLRTIKHSVVFGIDGLKGIHEIYRQGTDFDKIIENAEAFIQNGGNAEWQFLTFKHNVHQIKDCMRLGQRLGFKKFTVKKSIRVPNPARNYLTGKSYVIESDDKFDHTMNNHEKEVTVDDCMHLSMPSIYVNADGTLAPCCYLTDVVYDNNKIDDGFLDRCKTHCGRSVVAHKN